jgi:ATP-binding cassette subfamily C protein CydCD
LELATGLGGLAVVAVGAGLVQGGGMPAALLPLLTLLAMAAFLPISEIANIGRQLADTLGATRRLYAVYEEEVPVRDGPGGSPKELASGAPAMQVFAPCAAISQSAPNRSANP